MLILNEYKQNSKSRHICRFVHFKTKVQFYRGDINSVFLSAAKFLLWVTESLKGGSSVVLFIQQVFSNVNYTRFYLSLYYCMYFSSQCIMVTYLVRCFSSFFISSLKSCDMQLLDFKELMIYMFKIFNSFFFIFCILAPIWCCSLGITICY